MKLMCQSVKKEGREQTFGEHSQPRDRHKPLLSHHCGLDQKQVPCLRKSIYRFVVADRLPIQGLQKRHREGKQDSLNVGNRSSKVRYIQNALENINKGAGHDSGSLRWREPEVMAEMDRW